MPPRFARSFLVALGFVVCGWGACSAPASRGPIAVDAASPEPTDGAAGGRGGGAGRGGAGGQAPDAGGTNMSDAGTTPDGGGSAGAGGVSGAGGMAGTGGTAGMGGMAGVGGMSGAGGTAGMGGMAGIGGMAGTGGMAGGGGMAGMGGMAGGGGMAGMGPGAVKAGLVGYWPLDEGAGTTTADRAGSRTGTLSAGVSWAAGGIRNPAFANAASVTFDGVAGRIDVGADLAALLGGTATLSVWIRTTQVGAAVPWNAPGLTGVEQNGNSNDVFWGYLRDTGGIAIQAGNGAAATSGPINDGQWHHVALTRNATTGALAVFVDGTMAGSAAGETGAKTTPFQVIGQITGSSAGFLQGSLDDVRVYDRVLEAAEIQAIAGGR